MGEFTGRAGYRGRSLRRPGYPARLVQRVVLSGAPGAITAVAPEVNSPIISSHHDIQSLPRERGVGTDNS